MVRTPREAYQDNQVETPPETDPDMWRRLLNLLYWLERDEDFRWAKAVKAAICGEGNEPPDRERSAPR